MAWNGLTLTVEGRNALNQAQAGAGLCFKSIVVGDGDAPANFQTRRSLVHQLYELTELKLDVTEEGCTLTADFPQVEYDYYFREVGIIVITESGEKLYVYDNCGEDAQYIVSTTGVETREKRLRLSLIISDVADITLLTPSILYVSYDDFDREISWLKQNKVSTKGGDISATVAEFEESAELVVPESGEDISTIFGKLKKAVRELISHIGNKNNPHKVTKEQIGLGNAENTSDADKPVSNAVQEALDAYYTQLTAYADKAIADLINGAPTTLDTLKELADAINDNKSITDALNEAIGKKANTNELGSAAYKNVVNNDTTTVDGYVADARIVKTHGDEIDELNKNLTKKQDALTAITTSNIGSQAVNKATHDSGGYHIHDTLIQILGSYTPKSKYGAMHVTNFRGVWSTVTVGSYNWVTYITGCCVWLSNNRCDLHFDILLRDGFGTKNGTLHTQMVNMDVIKDALSMSTLTFDAIQTDAQVFIGQEYVYDSSIDVRDLIAVTNCYYDNHFSFYRFTSDGKITREYYDNGIVWGNLYVNQGALTMRHSNIWRVNVYGASYT